MREIKFRAWIPDEELMIELPCTDGNHISEITETGIIVTRFNDYIVKESGGNIVETEGYEPCESNIMQFTGLHDKNGKGVYEGDIVEDVFFNRIMLVEWWMNSFCFKAITETNFIRACEMWQWYNYEGVYNLNKGQFEIIGNKYHNQELLQKTEVNK